MAITYTKYRSLIVLLGALAVWTDTASGNLSTAVRTDTEWLGSYASRSVASDAHDSAQAELYTRLKAIPGIQIWQHKFKTVVPYTSEATLTIPAAQGPEVYRIYPLMPAGAQLNTTPAAGISGKLLYVHNGDYDDLPAYSLKGQIAVIEFNSNTNWKKAFSLGARAVIFLGSTNESWEFVQSNLSQLPLAAPRFYIPPGPLADALRQQTFPAGTLFCRAAWVEKTSINYYALVKPGPKAGTPLPAIAVCVPYDAMSIVPELAPGADAAVDAAFALNCVRQFADQRPKRPVLFAFLDAYAVNLSGMHQMLFALQLPPDNRNKKEYKKDDRKLLAEYSLYAALANELGSSPEQLQKIRLDKYKKLHRFVKDEVALEVIALETQLAPLRLQLFSKKISPETSGALIKQIAELDEKRNRYYMAQKTLLAGTSSGHPLTTLTQTLWIRALTRINNQYQECLERQSIANDIDSLRLGLLYSLGLTDPAASPLNFAIGIDLSDRGTTIGPSIYTWYQNIGEMGNFSEFRLWLTTLQEREALTVWPDPVIRRAINLEPLTTLDSPDSYVQGSLPNTTAPTSSFGLGGMTWSTLQGTRPSVSTPCDRTDNLKWNRLNPQIEATFALLNRLMSDRNFDPGDSPTPRWQRIEGTIVDQAPGEPVPSLPMQRYLTTLYNGSQSNNEIKINWRAVCQGIWHMEFKYTGTDGRCYFDAIPLNVGNNINRFVMQSYKIGTDGSINRAIDLLKVGKGVNLTSSPMRAVVFNCEQFQQFDLYDSRSLLKLPNLTVLDYRRGNLPQRCNVTALDGDIVGFLEPNVQYQLILRAGATSNRMLLLNMLEPSGNMSESLRESMRGFRVGQPLPDLPFYIAARDFFRLDEERVASYHKAGITSQAINLIHQDTKKLLEQSDSAYHKDQGGLFFKAASGALANEIRAYQAIQNMANDVVRAAIFLLLMLIPFAYVMERLLIATPFIYRQVGGVFGIFTLMTGILWSFHPAFKISSQPLMIVMSFGIIFLSLMVISVIYAKFEAGLEDLRSHRAEASEAKTSSSGVLSSAFQLGIANMRKRKVRTILTSVTIVLITFTLLCFTSVNTFVSKKEYSLQRPATFTGVVIRQPTNWDLPSLMLDYTKSIIDPQNIVAYRYWESNTANAQWRTHLVNQKTGKAASFSSILGLSYEEAALTHIDRLVPNWERFRDGNGCYMAEQTARELNVQPGDSVSHKGRNLVLLGTYKAAQIDKELKDMDGQSLMPLDFSAISGDQMSVMQGSATTMLINESEKSSGAFAKVSEYPHLSSRATAIVHSSVISTATLRSIAIGTPTAAKAEDLARELADRLSYPIYYGIGSDVRIITSTPLLPQGPKSLAVPLIIACLIIFNTMLSAVAERKREIHIYTSLGLAPLHIGVLFLAEAITYSLMGSIFGYVVGQGVATFLTKMGWMGGIVLNYSGTQAIATMFMVLGVVIISSLVPAYMAGRMAVPSTDRSWRVPKPENDLIIDVLPFTFTGQMTNGMMNYLFEYLEAHREGSIGHFSTDNMKLFVSRIGDREFLGLTATVWLEPFDLSVRQDITLSIQAAADEDVYELRIELHRSSGQVNSWWKLNKVFMSALRKQLLGWRNIKTERIVQHMQDGEKLLNQARS